MCLCVLMCYPMDYDCSGAVFYDVFSFFFECYVSGLRHCPLILLLLLWAFVHSKSITLTHEYFVSLSSFSRLCVRCCRRRVILTEMAESKSAAVGTTYKVFEVAERGKLQVWPLSFWASSSIVVPFFFFPRDDRFPHSRLQLAERKIPALKANEVLVKVRLFPLVKPPAFVILRPAQVLACGVCHGDTVAVLGQWPGIKFPWSMICHLIASLRLPMSPAFRAPSGLPCR